MPLTAVIGSSGSGKTTFLNDVHKSHEGTYIRQYHNMRPYIVVSQIPNFDPTKLPFWSIYEHEGKAATIQAGGMKSGGVTSGLSGGQRKMLLFELICQRVQSQQDLLIILDEPFAGVTDNFVPYVIERLEELRAKHNVLLVTNDHVDAITKMADNTITVSAIDRTIVTVNKRQKKRDKTIAALCIGEKYSYDNSREDIKFFYKTEIGMNTSLLSLFFITMVAYSMYIVSLWDTSEKSIGLAIVGAELVIFFTFTPYCMTLVDWRNDMQEESEALMHSSKGTNKFLKMILTLSLLVMATFAEFGIINGVLDGFSDFKFLLALVCDNFFVLSPYVVLGIYADLSLQAIENLAGVLYMGVIFFSTTFSPGSGVSFVKILRYLYPRFYFWCMLPGLEGKMEGCPSDDRILWYMILSSMHAVTIFLLLQMLGKIKKLRHKKEKHEKLQEMIDESFLNLESELKSSRVIRCPDLMPVQETPCRNNNEMDEDIGSFDSDDEFGGDETITKGDSNVPPSYLTDATTFLSKAGDELEESNVTTSSVA
jgi:ABC-type lipoprotein export system ATPase subunit